MLAPLVSCHATLGMIHTIGPVALRSRSALGQLTVLVYSHVQSALAPLSIISSPSTPVEGISPVTEDV